MHTPSNRSLFLLALLASVVGCSRKQGGDDDENRARMQPVVAVRTAPVTIGDAVVSITAVGRTDAMRREKVFSPIAGRIVSLNVLEGAGVHAGNILLSILTKESQAAINGAEGLLRTAKTERQRAEAERMVELARSSQSVATIVAKFDGVVASRNVSEGELVAENAELLSIVDLGTIVFLADVPLQDVSAVRTGFSAVVRFPSLPGRELRAAVDAILPQGDAQNQTARVRLRFTGLTSTARSVLRTEVAGTAQIIVGIHPHVTIIPKTALLRDDEKGTYSVVIVTPDSVAQIVSVTVGVATDSTVEVQSPLLKAAMPVVIMGNYALTDSTKVSLVPKDVQ